MANFWYPTLLQDETAFPAHMLFTFFKRDNTTSSSIEDQVHLYMPEQFGQPNTVSWDSSFKGGQAVLSAIGGGVNKVADWAADKGVGGAKSVANAAAGLQSIAGGAAGDLQGLGEQAAGMMLNPYLTQVFRAVDFRNFQYTFRFVPFSPSDCDTILEILNTFRKWALPEGEQGGASVYLSYPGEVEIEYIFNGGGNQYLHKFKRSVITSIDINYTGAGMWTMMRNGFPTETVMNVSFSEIQIVVRKDVSELGY